MLRAIFDGSLVQGYTNDGFCPQWAQKCPAGKQMQIIFLPVFPTMSPVFLSVSLGLFLPPG